MMIKNIVDSIKMASKKLIMTGLVCNVMALTLSFQPASALTEAQQGAISQNCATIKQSLKQLQKVDSRTRTYLGTTYETLVNKFITPLNLRLVKNNLPTLSTIQANFTNEQNEFKENYTDYMRELESLIAIDCKSHPQDFYSKLESVRTKRTALRNSTVKMSKLADEQYKSVIKLQEEL